MIAREPLGGDTIAKKLKKIRFEPFFGAEAAFSENLEFLENLENVNRENFTFHFDPSPPIS